MHAREFLVLDDDDGEFVARLTAGLGEDAARVLAFLLLRESHGDERNEPATRLTVRIGTELSRSALADALATLEDRGLVDATTVRRAGRGRPPEAWRPAVDEVPRAVYASHAVVLLGRAEEVAASTALGRVTDDSGGASGAAESDGADDSDGSDGSERTSDPGADDDRDPLRLALNWRPNGLHAPLYAAIAGGRDAAFGLDVDVEAYEGSDRAVAAVVDGDADVGLAGAATVVRARAAGAPVVPLALLYQRAMTVLYANREAFDRPLARAEQLRGARVGAPPSSETGLLARVFLAQAGVLDAVELVDLAGEEREALRDGRVDAVTGQGHDPRDLRTTGAQIDVLPVADRFPMYGPALVATEATLGERRPLLERVLAAATWGWADAVERPREAAAALPVDEGERDREREAFERAAEEFGGGETVRAHGWGWHDAEGWERLRTALDQVGLLAADV